MMGDECRSKAVIRGTRGYNHKEKRVSYVDHDPCKYKVALFSEDHSKARCNTIAFPVFPSPPLPSHLLFTFMTSSNPNYLSKYHSPNTIGE
jgi:hypothetical protein